MSQKTLVLVGEPALRHRATRPLEPDGINVSETMTRILLQRSSFLSEPIPVQVANDDAPCFDVATLANQLPKRVS